MFPWDSPDMSPKNLSKWQRNVYQNLHIYKKTQYLQKYQFTNMRLFSEITIQLCSNTEKCPVCFSIKNAGCTGNNGINKITGI